MPNMTGRRERLASPSGLAPGTEGPPRVIDRPRARGHTIRLHLHLDGEDLCVAQLAYDVYDETGDRITTCVLPAFPFGATLEQATREFRRHYVGLPQQLRLATR